eukprot:3937308-Rhodomonas_salina.1
MLKEEHLRQENGRQRVEDTDGFEGANRANLEALRSGLILQDELDPPQTLLQLLRICLERLEMREAKNTRHPQHSAKWTAAKEKVQTLKERISIQEEYLRSVEQEQVLPSESEELWRAMWLTALVLERVNATKAGPKLGGLPAGAHKRDPELAQAGSDAPATGPVLVPADAAGGPAGRNA